MTYKKYIRKNGKVYGPYIYSSKRIDGKVVSEYHGFKEKKPFNKNIFIFAGMFILILSLFLVVLINPRFSGFVTMNLEGNYVEGQILEGVLYLELKEGEFIPASSKIVFENLDNYYEYSLEDLIEEQPVEGNFYIEGTSISGQGLGYGVAKKKEIYPRVYFKLKIVSEETSSEPGISKGGSGSEKPVKKEPIEEDNETIEDVNEIVEKSEETIGESVEEPIEKEDSGEGEVTGEFVEEPEVASGARITGNVIRGFFQGISNFFLGLTPTGKVVSESQDFIQGDVVFGEEFTYNLKKDETVEIVEGSVLTETKELSKEALDLKIEENKLIVTTNYYEEEEGYGEDYLSEEKKIISIDLSSLELFFDKGKLVIKILYQDEEIVSYNIKLGENISTNQTIVKPVLNESNKTIAINETFVNVTNKTFEVVEIVLTEKEVEILKNYFGNETVEQTAKLYRNWIIVKFILGNYEVEYSYDEDLPKDTLNSLIEKDKINWLKDLVKSISEEPSDYENLDNFSESYGF